MTAIFNTTNFKFPYNNLKFPGQHSEERILFVTREGKVILKIKISLAGTVILVGLVLGVVLLNSANILGLSFSILILPFALMWILGGVLVTWWIYRVWQKTLFIITTRRLTKFIHTTPWSRYQMSLGLDQIVDTGAYQIGWFQMATGLGYFVARSAAGAIKNFKIENISFAEDLHNYVNKLLFVFNEHALQLDRFRPFIPHLKGEVRDQYVRQTAPQYAKPIRQ